MVNKSFLFVFSIFFISLVSGAVIIGESPEEIKGVVIRSPLAQTFLDLTDTPASYAGEAGNCVKVTAGEDGLEFGACGAGGGGNDGDFNFTDFHRSFGLNFTEAFNSNISAGGYVQNGTDGWNVNFTWFNAERYQTDQGNFWFNFHDDGSEAFLNASSVTDAFGLETENSKLILYNNPSVGNDFKVMQTFSKQAQDTTEFVITKAGRAHQSYIVRSFGLVGNGSQIGTPFNCSTFANYIDCRTDFSGPDFYVLDSAEINNTLWVMNNITSINGNVTADFFTGNEAVLNTNLTLQAQGAGIIFENGAFSDVTLVSTPTISNAVVQVPGIAGTLASLAGIQTFTGVKTFSNNISVEDTLNATRVVRVKTVADSNQSRISINPGPANRIENISRLMTGDTTGVTEIQYTFSGYLHVTLGATNPTWDFEFKDCANNTVQTDHFYMGFGSAAMSNARRPITFRHLNKTAPFSDCYSLAITERTGVSSFEFDNADLVKVYG